MMQLWAILLAALVLLPLRAVPQEKGAAGAGVEWRVSGVVRGQHGPVKGIWVIPSGPEFLRGVRTDSQGRYELKGRLPGTYSLRIQKPEDAGSPSPRTLTLNAGSRLSDVDFRLPIGGAIEGRVTDEGGDGIGRLVVMAYEVRQADGAKRLLMRGGAITDERGNYRIANLPPAEFVVGAVTTTRNQWQAKPASPATRKPTRPAYPAITFAPEGRALPGASVLWLEEDGERSGVDIRMRKEPTYCVSFQAGAGEVPMGADGRFGLNMTEWLGAMGPVVASQMLDKPGDFEICGVPSGEYLLDLVGLEGKRLKGLGYVRNTVMVDRQDTDAGSLELRGLVKLQGKVQTSGALAVKEFPEGVSIQLSLVQRSLLPHDNLQTSVKPDGSFALEGVYADEYVVKLDHLPTGNYVTRAAQAGRNLLKEKIQTAGGEIIFEIASDGPSISGRVTPGGGGFAMGGGLSGNVNDRSMQTLPDVAVFLISEADGQVVVARSDQDGVYRFASGLAPGKYRIGAVRTGAANDALNAVLKAQFEAVATDVELGARQMLTKDLVVSADK